MRLVLTIFWIILAFFILWIFSLNVGQIVDIDLFFTKFETVNLVTVIFSSVFIGFGFGIIFFLIQLKKKKKENFQMKRQLKAFETELSNLKGQQKDIQITGSSQMDKPIEEKDIHNNKDNSLDNA